MNLTCYDYLKACAKKTGDYDAVLAFGSRTKLSRIIRDTDSLAAYINSIGIVQGDVVTIFLPNVVHSFTTFYSLNKIGVIANIVHPLTSPEGLAEILETTGSKAIFVLDILAGKYAQVVNDAKIPCIICSNSDYIMLPAVPAFKVFEKIKGKNLDEFKNSVKYSRAVSTSFICPTAIFFPWLKKYSSISLRYSFDDSSNFLDTSSIRFRAMFSYILKN